MNDAQTRHAHAFQQLYGFVEFQIREKFNKIYIQSHPTYVLLTYGFRIWVSS